MRTMTLDEIATFAKQHKITPAEKRAQRVSLMMGLRSKNSSLTREEASSLLDQIEGHEAREDKPKR
jgi:hypothetical protein